MIESSLIFVIVFLGIDGLIKQPLYKAALLRNGFHDLCVHSVKDTRDTAHESWLQALHVLHQLERVSTVVASLEALQEGEDEDALLEGVTVGQVGDHRIFIVELEVKVIYQVHAGKETLMSQHRTLRVPGCA